MELNRKLAKLMADRDWKAPKVAFLLGEMGCPVSESKVRRWADEAAERPTLPSIREARCLARLFGVPLDYLADDDQDEPSAGNTGPTPLEWEILRTVEEKKLEPRQAVEALVMWARIRDEGGGVVVSKGADERLARPDADEKRRRENGGPPPPSRRHG